MNAPTNPPCLILAGESWGGGLHAIRSLGSRGVPVYVAVDGAGANVYRRSRYCVEAVDIEGSDPRAFCSQVIAWMEGVAGSETPVLVIPLSDRLCEFLHVSRDLFAASYTLAIPSPATTDALLDKVQACQIAERAGLDVPPWVAVSCVEDIGAATALSVPVVVRPRSWDRAGKRRFKFEIFRTLPELEAGLHRLVDDGADVIAQEYIAGPDDAIEWSVVYGSRETGLVVTCTGRKRRQDAIGGGVMVWGEAVAMPALRDAIERFVHAAGFQGLGGLELKRSEGRSWFIEFNPRLEAIHFLASRSGVDTVWMAYRELALGEPVTEAPTQRPAAAMVGNAWINRLTKTRDWRIAVRDLAEFVRSPRKVFAVLSWSDPLPWIDMTGHMMANVMGRWRK